MGASGWSHFVPYEKDLSRALGKLREAVFHSGTFYASRGAKKSKTIAELLKRNGESGTHSVLDVDRISPEPLPPSVLRWHSEVLAKTGAPPPPEEFQKRLIAESKFYGAVGPIPDEKLIQVFGTNRPTHAQVEAQSFGLFNMITRGCGLYVLVYEDNDTPNEIFFIGMSGD